MKRWWVGGRATGGDATPPSPRRAADDGPSRQSLRAVSDLPAHASLWHAQRLDPRRPTCSSARLRQRGVQREPGVVLRSPGHHATSRVAAHDTRGLRSGQADQGRRGSHPQDLAIPARGASGGVGCLLRGAGGDRRPARRCAAYVRRAASTPRRNRAAHGRRHVLSGCDRAIGNPERRRPAAASRSSSPRDTGTIALSGARPAHPTERGSPREARREPTRPEPTAAVPAPGRTRR